MRSRYLWIIAFVLVAAAAVYQRRTGPTHPVSGGVTLGPRRVEFRLPRSHGGEGDARIRLSVPDGAVTGTVELRRFPSPDPWTKLPLAREGDELVAAIPHQPPSGKVLYRVTLEDGGNAAALTPRPVVIRFKGAVPAVIMIPHIAMMFLAMLLSTRAGLQALLRRPGVFRLAAWTAAALAAGGLLLGPLVQNMAFGAYWTGWPIGQDLTDNKTVVAFLFWAVALWRLRRRPEAYGWAVASSVVLLLVYLIPHSLLGSELDFTRLPASDL